MRFEGSWLYVRGALAAVALSAAFVLAPATARAADAKHFGVGTACVFGNLLYGPAKFIVAVVGSVTSGFAYAVTAGDLDVTRKILDSSVMGDYVVLPEHFTGEKRLEFIGNPRPAPADDWGAPPPDNSGF